MSEQSEPRFMKGLSKLQSEIKKSLADFDKGMDNLEKELEELEKKPKPTARQFAKALQLLNEYADDSEESL